MAKKYVNKSQHYSFNGMVSRTQLAVIDHNCNVGERCPPPLLEMNATSVYIQSYRNSGGEAHIRKEVISVCPRSSE